MSLTLKPNALFLDVSQVVLSSDTLDLDSGKVRHSTTPHHNDTVLLEVVTFARDVGRGLLACAEPHAHTLPVGRVGLLGLLDERLEHHAPQLGPTVHGALFLRFRSERPLAVHLIKRRHGP